MLFTLGTAVTMLVQVGVSYYNQKGNRENAARGGALELRLSFFAFRGVGPARRPLASVGDTDSSVLRPDPACNTEE